MSADLLALAHRVARYWGNRDRWLADEYEAVAVAALGEAIVHHDPDKAPLEPYAIYLMHKRCRDLSRAWVISRQGRRRTVPCAFEDWDTEQRNFPDVEPPYDDTRWLLAQLLRTVDEARAGGRISAKARAAVLLWLELEHQGLVAERLGVTESRVSQLVHEVIDAVREIGVAS